EQVHGSNHRPRRFDHTGKGDGRLQETVTDLPSGCCPVSAVPCRLFLVVVENKVDQFHRAYRGYCVFIYQLLPSVGIQYDGEVVKALYRALQLETVRKVDGHRKMFFSYLVQKYILQIDIWFVHLTILLDH